MSNKNFYIPVRLIPYIFTAIATISIAATSNIIA